MVSLSGAVRDLDIIVAQISTEHFSDGNEENGQYLPDDWPMPGPIIKK
jgi:hypothetical protein